MAWLIDGHRYLVTLTPHAWVSYFWVEALEPCHVLLTDQFLASSAMSHTTATTLEPKFLSFFFFYFLQFSSTLKPMSNTQWDLRTKISITLSLNNFSISYLHECTYWISLSDRFTCEWREHYILQFSFVQARIYIFFHSKLSFFRFPYIDYFWIK